jgi:hypothetical protein
MEGAVKKPVAKKTKSSRFPMTLTMRMTRFDRRLRCDEVCVTLEASCPDDGRFVPAELHLHLLDVNYGPVQHEDGTWGPGGRLAGHAVSEKEFEDRRFRVTIEEEQR